MKFNDAYDLAVKACRRSNMQQKLGVCLFDSKKYVIGWNRSYGCKTNKRTPWSIHAEEMAILKGNRIGIDFSDATMIVLRINGRISKPCESCQKLIESVGIKRIYYIG